MVSSSHRQVGSPSTHSWSLAKCRSRSSTAGLGIGMRIASNILHLLQPGHSDKFKISSKVGKGTTVQFEISQGIANSEEVYSSSLDSQDSHQEDLEQQRVNSERKLETQGEEFDNDRMSLRYSSQPIARFSPSNRATLSVDSSKVHVRSSSDKWKPPLQSKTFAKKLIPEHVKSRGFVRGIGNRTLRAMDSFDQYSVEARGTNSRCEDRAAKVFSPVKTLSLVKETHRRRKQITSKLDSDRKSDSQPTIKDDRSFDQQLRRPRVLIVDDEVINLEFARFALKTIGFKVYTASRGDEALQLADNLLAKHINLQLVLMDYNMPQMTGDLVVKALLDRKYGPVMSHAKIFGLTAQNDQRVTSLDHISGQA